MTGSSSARKTIARQYGINLRKKNWERKLFYLLTPALMGDFLGHCFSPIAVTGLILPKYLAHEKNILNAAH